MSRARLHIVCATLIYFILFPWLCYSLGIAFLWASAIWTCVLHVLPSSSVPADQCFPILWPQWSCGRGKEHWVAGEIVSKPECWARKGISDIYGLITSLLCPSEPQPTWRKCSRGHSVPGSCLVPGLTQQCQCPVSHCFPAHQHAPPHCTAQDLLHETR